MNNGEQQSSNMRLHSEASIERILHAEGSTVGVFWAIEEDIQVTINGDNRVLTTHTGSDPGAFSMMLFDPVSDTGVVIVGNDHDVNLDDSLKSLLEELFRSAGEMQ